MEKIFVNGLIFKRPRNGAPEFVKGSLAIKVDELIAFLNQHKKADGWVNATLKESKGGKLYFELDTWTKTIGEKAGEETKKVVEQEINASEIPF